MTTFINLTLKFFQNDSALLLGSQNFHIRYIINDCVHNFIFYFYVVTFYVLFTSRILSTV